MVRALISFCSLLVSSLCFAGDPGYHVVKKLQIGRIGGLDCLIVGGAIDPETGNIYLPAAEFAPPVASAAGVKPRPVMIKDSFAVLVVGKRWRWLTNGTSFSHL